MLENVRKARLFWEIQGIKCYITYVPRLSDLFMLERNCSERSMFDVVV